MRTALLASHRPRLALAALAAALACAAFAPAAAAQNVAIAYAPPPPPRPSRPGPDLFGGENRPPVRVSFSLIGTVGGYFDSAYNAALRPWGYGSGWFAAGVALETGVHLNRYVMLGARGAFTGASTSDISHRGYQNPGLSTWDAGGVLRLSAPVLSSREGNISLGVQFEGGLANTTLSLRGDEAVSPWLPRLGVTGIFSVWDHGFGVSARVSYQHLSWPGAGGQNVDLGMDGLLFGLALEGGVL